MITDNYINYILLDKKNNIFNIVTNQNYKQFYNDL